MVLFKVVEVVKFFQVLKFFKVLELFKEFKVFKVFTPKSLALSLTRALLLLLSPPTRLRARLRIMIVTITMTLRIVMMLQDYCHMTMTGDNDGATNLIARLCLRSTDKRSTLGERLSCSSSAGGRDMLPRWNLAIRAG